MKKKQLLAVIFFTASIITAAAAVGILLTNPKITKEHLEIYLEAKRAYITGDLNTAVSLTTVLTKKSPLLYQGQLLLGKSLFLMDQYIEADRFLAKLLNKHPAYLEAGLWKARTEIQLNLIEDAHTRVENLLSYNSDDPRLLGLMGNIEEQKGNHGQAIDFYKRASLYEEELAKNRLSLGKLYSRLGVYDKSYYELLQAKELLEADSPLYKPLNIIMAEVNARINK